MSPPSCPRNTSHAMHMPRAPWRHCLCASALMLSGTLAQAQDAGTASAPDARRWSVNATLASQYLARGVRQSWGQPAVQAGIDYSHPQGFFLGAWGSSLSPRFIDGGHMELDLYGGYSWSAGPLNYSAGLYYYMYPGARMAATGTRYNYGEAVLSANYQWLTVKYALTVTRDYFGYNSSTLLEGTGRHSRGSGYLDIGLNVPLAQGTELQLHYGWQRVRSFSRFNWQDVRVALSKSLGSGWTLVGGVTRAYNSHGVYDAYTTGTPDARGRLHYSNPTRATAFVTLGTTF